MRQKELASPKTNGGFNPIVDSAQPHWVSRDQMIAEAAYFIANGRGFEGDHALDDWLEAEALIDSESSSGSNEQSSI